MPKSIEMGFVEPKNQYPSSINIAYEHTNVSLKKYIQSVKSLYELKKDKRLTDLGKIQLQIGTGHLFEIDHQSTHGTFRQLQLIVPIDGKMVILTSASHQDDFLQVKDEILKALRSLTVVDQITDSLTKEERGLNIAKINQLKKDSGSDKEILEKYASFLHSRFQSKGPYWALLMMKDFQKAVSQ